MRLLYIITSTGVGGAEKSLAELVHAMAAVHTVRVICLKPLGPLAQQFSGSGAEVVSLQMRGSGAGIVSKLVREIETFKPDVVHAMLYRAILFSRLACAGRRLKLVTTPHFDMSQKPYWMRLLDRLLKQVDTVSVAESVSTYDYLLSHQGYKKSKTLLIGNTVDKKRFFKDTALRQQMRQQHGFSPEDVIFISVARLSAVKNHDTLLRAFWRIIPSCPHAKLVIVGEGEEQARLSEFIKEKNLSKTVFLVGKQDNISAWLNMADVFVLVSTEESLPLALLEAKQVGLPCIVSNVGDMPKQIIHGKSGFVCKPKDVILISCLLAELYENKQLRLSMGEAVIHSNPQVINSFQQYQQLYQQLITN